MVAPRAGIWCALMLHVSGSRKCLTGRTEMFIFSPFVPQKGSGSRSHLTRRPMLAWPRIDPAWRDSTNSQHALGASCCFVYTCSSKEPCLTSLLQNRRPVFCKIPNREAHGSVWHLSLALITRYHTFHVSCLWQLLANHMVPSNSYNRKRRQDTFAN